MGLSKKIDFATIEEIPLKQYFETEDRHFTPWLQENIDKLANVIGIDIDNAETEVQIGNYRLDILAYESGTNRRIAVENQYGKTDHSHLGQLITYMAGINAGVVVWLAENFNSEHISAINHLNQISDEDVGFFCIKPRLIKIGDSKPAIEFVIIAKPDEWEKQVKSETKVSDRGIAYKEFWKLVIDKYQQQVPDFNPRKIQPRYAYDIPAGKTGINYNWRFTSKGFFEIGLWIGTRSKQRNHEIAEEIISNKDSLEKQLGTSLLFWNNENNKATSVNLRYNQKIDILTISENEKQELINWIVKWMHKFKESIDPIIQKM
jgi:hypothetical protein